VRELVRLREEGHARQSALVPPDSFELAAGSYLPLGGPAAAGPNEASVVANGTELCGVGACGGRVTAPAAILQDVSEFRLLRQGDVLVTRQTDPGWGPVFFLIKGLVIERGGLLSHGAILAREFGIPAVVGVREATRRIAPGQTLFVNGDRGVVQLAR
jgi:pyruvate,water dikinase